MNQRYWYLFSEWVCNGTELQRGLEWEFLSVDAVDDQIMDTPDGPYPQFHLTVHGSSVGCDFVLDAVGPNGQIVRFHGPSALNYVRLGK